MATLVCFLILLLKTQNDTHLLPENVSSEEQIREKSINISDKINQQLKAEA